MPFAQVHYPFENADWFEHHYPGDFIVEYIGQTRGWFYTMHVLATALFDRPAFRNCVSHGILLGADGRKMSKSLRNYPDVYEMFDVYGSDAMRWMLMSSPVLRGGDMPVTETGDPRRGAPGAASTVERLVLLLAVRQRGGVRGAAADRLDAPARPVRAGQDRRAGRGRSRAQMDAYDISGACAVGAVLPGRADQLVRAPVPGPVLGRRPRTRSTPCYTVLETLCRVVAPLAPLTAEEIWRGLTGERSVHLTDWPAADAFPADHDLVAAMDAVRDVCSAALSLRKAQGPAGAAAAADAHRGHAGRGRAASRSPTWSPTRSTSRRSCSPPTWPATASRCSPWCRGRSGPRVGGQVQQVIKAVKAGDWSLVDGRPVAAGVTLQEGEYELQLVAADAEHSAPLPGGEGVVVLDTEVTPELAAEGLARDVVRVVQQARREAGLDVSDRISLVVEASAGGGGGGRGAPGLRGGRDAGDLGGARSGRRRGLRRRGRRGRDPPRGGDARLPGAPLTLRARAVRRSRSTLRARRPARADRPGAECRGRVGAGRGGPVPDSYTVFWTMDRGSSAVAVGHKPLPVLFGGPHLSEPSFRRAGVKVGDVIYPVAVSNRRVHVVARMRVREMVLLGQEDGPTLIDQRFPQFKAWRFLAPDLHRGGRHRDGGHRAPGRPRGAARHARAAHVPVPAAGAAPQARQGRRADQLDRSAGHLPPAPRTRRRIWPR